MGRRAAAKGRAPPVGTVEGKAPLAGAVEGRARAADDGDGEGRRGRRWGEEEIRRIQEGGEDREIELKKIRMRERKR